MSIVAKQSPISATLSTCIVTDDSDVVKRFKGQNDERSSEWNQGNPQCHVVFSMYVFAAW